jgi:hypothetical protein
MDTPCTSTLLAVRIDTPCTSALLAVKRDTPGILLFTLLTVEIPPTSILLVVERDTHYTVPRTHPARPYCGLARDLYLLNDVEKLVKIPGPNS